VGVTRSQLIIQRDLSLVVTPGYGRDRVASVARSCAELARIVAGGYVYRLSPVAIWGSAARGMTASELLEQLDRYSATDIPASLVARVSEIMGRYGVLRVQAEGDMFRLVCSDVSVLESIDFGIDLAATEHLIPLRQVGRLKLLAAKAGWPVTDVLRPDVGRLPITLNDTIALRRYQREAVEAFQRAGNGVILLPCGAGKTVVGVAVACDVSSPTLILGPSRSVADQWSDTFLSATSLTPEQVSIASPDLPVTAVTIATYHAASFGQVAGRLLDHPWGLVIYDEVQSLPADVFRLSAALPAARKLGLSATLVREDGRQSEVFALIGPPVYDVPWIELEQQGWIAPARCAEVRIPEAHSDEQRARFRNAVIERLLELHNGQQVLIVGSNLAGLEAVSRRFNIPMLSGKSGRERRNIELDAFRAGDTTRLIMSRIGSVGIDLPGAEVLIQVSGTFGSRQEEAQRLGRLLRPAPGKVARFYSLVSSGTSEVRYAEKRQRFLVEQGYEYDLLDAADIPRVRRQ
jgi:DNA excision repair protein ERCC-3